MGKFVCLADFEKHALTILDKVAADFYSCGANEEITLAENLEAYKR